MTKPNERPTLITDKRFHEIARGGTPENVSLCKGVAGTVRGIDEKTRKIGFIISSESVDRMGDVIKLDGWDLRAYKTNPVVLFAHQHKSPPVARAVRVWKDKKTSTLQATAEFMDRDISAFADSIFRMYVGGFLRATSVGFIPREFAWSEDKNREDGIDFLKQELLEFSAVPVPANADAVVSPKSMGIDVGPVSEWVCEILDTWGEGKNLLVGTSRRDVELFGKMVTPTITEHFRVSGEIRDSLRKTNLERLKMQDQEPDLDLDVVDDAADDDAAATAAATDSADGDVVVADDAAVDVVDRGPIGYASAHSGGTPKAPKDESWDGPGQVAAASVDDLSVMCTWRADKPKADLVKGDFKLPHHKAAGSHSVVFRGITAAAARLPQTDIPEADVAGVQAHLGKHYGEFDETAPWDKDVDGWEKYVAACKAGDGALIAELGEKFFGAIADLNQDGVGDLDPADTDKGVGGEVKGAKLAALLNKAVDKKVTDKRPRSEVIKAMADAAGIAPNTVNEILAGSINCPPKDRFSGFAKVLDVTVDAMVGAATDDGCDYGKGVATDDPETKDVGSLFETLLTTLDAVMDDLESGDKDVTGFVSTRQGLRIALNVRDTCRELDALLCGLAGLEQRVVDDTPAVVAAPTDSAADPKKELDNADGDDNTVIELDDTPDEGVEVDPDELVTAVRTMVTGMLGEEIKQALGQID